jgi:hypothetical protein
MWQTVTILVQCGIIAFLAMLASRAIRDCWKARDSCEIEVSRNHGLANSITELMERNKELADTLLAERSKIPIAPKPKKEENSVIKGKNAGDVRRLMEQAVGSKMTHGGNEDASN